MVTLNFTLLIELGLFLLFMWVTHKLFFKPVLRTMDERDESIEQDHAQAEEDSKNARSIDAKHIAELTRIRRAAEAEYAEAKRKTSKDHGEFVRAERTRSDQTVAKAREKAILDIEVIRPAVLESSPEMVRLISERLNVAEGGND